MTRFVKCLSVEYTKKNICNDSRKKTTIYNEYSMHKKYLRMSIEEMILKSLPLIPAHQISVVTV